MAVREADRGVADDPAHHRLELGVARRLDADGAGPVAEGVEVVGVDGEEPDRLRRHARASGTRCTNGTPYRRRSCALASTTVASGPSSIAAVARSRTSVCTSSCSWSDRSWAAAEGRGAGARAAGAAGRTAGTPGLGNASARPSPSQPRNPPLTALGPRSGRGVGAPSGAGGAARARSRVRSTTFRSAFSAGLARRLRPAGQRQQAPELEPGGVRQVERPGRRVVDGGRGGAGEGLEPGEWRDRRGDQRAVIPGERPVADARVVLQRGVAAQQRLLRVPGR